MIEYGVVKSVGRRAATLTDASGKDVRFTFAAGREFCGSPPHCYFAATRLDRIPQKGERIVFERGVLDPDDCLGEYAKVWGFAPPQTAPADHAREFALGSML